jgi:VWFA-related protein
VTPAAAVWAAALLASSLAAASPAAARGGGPPPPPVFSASTESVYLDVFVTRDGEPVRGLSADDFEVLDGGRRVAAELVPTEDVPTSAVLVLDTSVSVSGARLVQLREACAAFVRRLAPRDEALLLTFASTVALRAAAGADRADLERALAGTEAGGRTALFDAVFSGLLMAPTLPGRPVLVVFSDGVDTVSWTGGSDSLALARQSSTLVYAVGVASDLLQEVVDATGGRTLSDSGKGLDAAFLRVLDDLRHRYLLRFVPAEGGPGWRPVEVKLRHARADVRHRPGYQRRPNP